ncbi:MAG: Dabb family protein [Saprospiraceae bacterium]
MKNLITLFLLISFLFGCQNPNLQLEKELSETKARLVAAKSALEKVNPTTKTSLVHEVYFNLKDDLTKDQKEEFHQNILKLKDIPEVQNLVVGDFKNLNDPRALADYEIKMSMEFQSEKEYAEYQAHPIHLSLKKAAGDIVAAPPVTYDFIKK